MRYAFSDISKEHLATCSVDLQKLFNEVIKYTDCIILEGHRSQEAQDLAFEKGLSKLKWPNGSHNSTPSLAADVAPYPIDWKDRERFLIFGGIVIGISKILGINIRWGGDWDGDLHTNDQHFNDLVHFEII